MLEYVIYTMDYSPQVYGVYSMCCFLFFNFPQSLAQYMDLCKVIPEMHELFHVQDSCFLRSD
jgi:hypothetical protein